MTRWWFALAPWVVGLLVAATVPRVAAGLGARDYLAPSAAAPEALARDVASYLDGSGPAILIGDARFEGEWALVTYQMTILGLGQLVLAHPELADRYVPVMEHAAERMMLPAQRDFATRAWGGDGLAALDTGRGDAWLGWPDLALSMLRLVHPTTKFAALNDRISAALARRIEHARFTLIETYPGQSFPTDVAACAAAVALHARATGADRAAWAASFVSTYRATWVDPASGYVWQQGDWKTGLHRDAPRGSGTAAAAYFLSFVDRAFASSLVDALARGERSFLGFGAIREYAGPHTGMGDVDSGPVVLGVSPAATGFAIGAARATGHDDLFVELYRTADLIGAPISRGDRTRFAAGGPFGNSILLAMLTAGQPR